ncbi:hypothetical protein BO996_18160 [Delftia sp. HK171]|uniref:hypothetical protein n=1 Tax=Delftia sp. HK171 TaxID=1920191 RepID=UPI0009035E5E|nr:hypothetical protein [Delftia sp. HK171]APE51667.1 hypothetical protein BO996_18160 [Delftia sp. HK171]
MHSSLDFSSWSSLLSTVLGLLLVTCLMMGIRLLFMQTVQKRRERENRQINERLKSLIAAYKTLGGSFTGTLHVNPLHLRDLRRPAADDTDAPPAFGSERQRRIRDAVEAALSDVILLGTQDQVRMAAQAAQDMVAGQPVETAALVTSLRAFIREALDLEPIPDSLRVPNQGPTRPGGTAGGARKGGAESGASSKGGGGGGAGMGAAGMGGLGMGAGLGVGVHHGDDGTPPP